MTGSDWIQTYTGRKFFPLDPDPEMICIEDIAHSLSQLCRYNGHSKIFYSVAQHSLVLSRELCSGWQYALMALLHDASEAYLSDLPRPLKMHPQFAFYRKAESRLQSMIYDRFLRFEWANIEKHISERDHLLLGYELASGAIFEELHPDFDAPNVNPPMIDLYERSPEIIEYEFLAEFNRLSARQQTEVGG